MKHFDLITTNSLSASSYFNKRIKSKKTHTIFNPLPSDNIKFSRRIKNNSFFNILSISLVVISLLLLIFKGLNFGIDFKGGTLIELRSADTKINTSSLRDNLNQMNLGDVSVKNFGNQTDFLIK